MVACLRHKRVACVTACDRAPGCARTQTGQPVQRSALNRRGLKNLPHKTHKKLKALKIGVQEPHQLRASGFNPPILLMLLILLVGIDRCATYQQTACQFCKKLECTRHQADLNWIFKYKGGGPQSARMGANKNWGIRPNFLGAVGCEIGSVHPTFRRQSQAWRPGALAPRAKPRAMRSSCRGRKKEKDFSLRCSVALPF